MAKNTERRRNAVESIRQAALELFVTKGFAETSLRDIGDKAGYTSGNIYHYFPTKRAIATDLAERLSENLANQEYWLLGQHQNTREQISTLIRDFFQWTIKNPHAAMFLYGFFDLRKVTEDNTLPILRAVPRHVVERLIIEGQRNGTVREGDPFRLSMAFTSVVEALRLYLGGLLTKAEYLSLAEDCSEIAWRALRADGAQ